VLRPKPKAPEPVASAAVAEEKPPAGPMPGRWTGHIWVNPGSLFMPPGFHSEDGSMDVILHFHGNPELVAESLAAANVNALVLVINMGLGSMAYRSPFAVGGMLDSMLNTIEAKTSAQIGRPMRVRRVALMSWSAGFGAVQSLLEQPGVMDRVDALLVADGIHPGYLPGGHEVDPAGIAPFVKFAKEAQAGRKLMAITHSEIPTYDYASSTESSEAILKELGITSAPSSDSPPPASFQSAADAFPARSIAWLQARSVAHDGNFFVWGYAGKDKPDHIAHLAQLSVTLLPPLAARWTQPPEAPPTAQVSAAISK
jgi:hypothetical protein